LLPMVARLKMKYKKLNIRKSNIFVNLFSNVGPWHFRDCLLLLPNKHFFAAVENFSRSNVPWAQITSHQSLFRHNRDVAIGGFGLLDHERAPFCLPPLTARLSDYQRGKDFPRYVGLWSRQAIAEAL
jgi:hypothetical protein